MCLQKDASEAVKELSEDDSEDSSENLSDSRKTENSAVCREMRTGRWMRRGTAPASATVVL